MRRNNSTRLQPVASPCKRVVISACFLRCVPPAATSASSFVHHCWRGPMDLLRNLGSAAVSSLVQKSGLNLPFTLGDKVLYFEGKTIWTLYEGTKRVRMQLYTCTYSRTQHRNLLLRTMVHLCLYSSLTRISRIAAICFRWRRTLSESCGLCGIQTS